MQKAIPLKNNTGLHQNENFCSSKDTIKNTKRKATNWVILFLKPEYIKNSYNSIEKDKQPRRNGPKAGHLTIKPVSIAGNPRKGAQYHSSGRIRD
jgi:uncharacterized membrane protein